MGLSIKPVVSKTLGSKRSGTAHEIFQFRSRMLTYIRTTSSSCVDRLDPDLSVRQRIINNRHFQFSGKAEMQLISPPAQMSCNVIVRSSCIPDGPSKVLQFLVSLEIQPSFAVDGAFFASHILPIFTNGLFPSLEHPTFPNDSVILNIPYLLFPLALWMSSELFCIISDRSLCVAMTEIVSRRIWSFETVRSSNTISFYSLFVHLAAASS